MSTEAVKLVDKSGLRMTKEKVLEMFRTSSQKEFRFSLCPNSKEQVFIYKP